MLKYKIEGTPYSNWTFYIWTDVPKKSLLNIIGVIKVIDLEDKNHYRVDLDHRSSIEEFEDEFRKLL